MDENFLGKRYDRWLALEKKHCDQEIELSAEQMAFIEQQNPQVRKCQVESTRPGEPLNQDTFYVGSLKVVGKVSGHYHNGSGRIRASPEKYSG